MVYSIHMQLIYLEAEQKPADGEKSHDPGERGRLHGRPEAERLEDENDHQGHEPEPERGVGQAPHAGFVLISRGLHRQLRGRGEFGGECGDEVVVRPVDLRNKGRGGRDRRVEAHGFGERVHWVRPSPEG